MDSLDLVDPIIGNEQTIPISEQGLGADITHRPKDVIDGWNDVEQPSVPGLDCVLLKRNVGFIPVGGIHQVLGLELGHLIYWLFAELLPANLVVHEPVGYFQVFDILVDLFQGRARLLPNSGVVAAPVHHEHNVLSDGT